MTPGGDTRSRRSLLWLLGLITLALVSLGVAGQAVTDALRYERDGVLRGEFWRLLTGHLVHGGARHLLLNLAGLGLIAALFPREFGWRGWLLIGALSIGIIDLGFVFWAPQLEWYVGFSGVLHGALAAGALAWWRTESRWLALALSVVLAGKLLWEQLHGALPLAGELPVVVDAHLYGALGGLAAGAMLLFAARRWPSRARSI